MAYDPATGSVAAWIQSDNASVITVSTPVVNQSVSGTVGASIIGNVPIVVQSSVAVTIISGSVAVTVTPPANQSISGAVNVSNFPANQSVSGTVVVNNGSVVSFQSGAWSVSVIGSVAAYQSGTWNIFVAGSVATVGTAAANQSVSGTVGASIIGQLPAGTAPLGSVATLQGTVPWIISSVYGNVSGSIAGTYTSSTVATTVTGLAVMFKPNVSSSIMTEISPTWPLPITGAIAASISGNVTINSPSIYGNISGSVVTTQGTSPWIVNFQNSSIIGINAGSVVTVSQGSVITLLQSSSIIAVPTGNQSISGTVNLGGTIVASIVGGASVFQYGTWQVSIAGTYATGAASIISGLGQLQLGLRNDSLASIYGANATYSPHTMGQWGETIIGVAPQAQWVNSTASTFTGVIQPVITSVSGSYINVTGIQIVNASANNAYLTFSQNGLGSVQTSSVVGYTVAPANGGSNITFPIPMRMTTVSRPFMASVSGVASVFITAQGFYSTT